MSDTEAIAPVVDGPENVSNNAGNSEEEALDVDPNVNNNATLKSGKKTTSKKSAGAPRKAVAPVSTPVKKTSKRPAAAAAHPKYSDMVAAAIAALKSRQGSSRQAIVKYIEANYKVGDNAALLVRKALVKGLDAGELVSTKGVGAAGSFRLAKLEKKPAAKVTKKPVTPKKKTAPAKKKTPVKKSPAAKKAVAKKTKSPAKKEPAKKSPAKKVAPKKSPAVAKAAAKKSPAATKAAAKKKSPAKKTPAATKKASPKKKVAPKKK